MTVFHRHHIIPRHAGGTDDPSNIERVTVAEHADRHRLLYEEHGRWQDRVAWLTLSGQIGFEEANLLAAAEGGKRPKTPEHRAALSRAKTGQRWTQEARTKASRTHSGMKHDEATKAKIGAAHKGRIIPAASIERYRKSRQATDGTAVKINGVLYGSHSEAAEALASVWGVSKETARGRVRRAKQ